MKDEESTQPIEIDALRESLAATKSPASAPRTQRQDGDFTTDEHPPIGDTSDPSLVRDTARNAAIPTRRDPQAGQHDHPASSSRMERTPRVAMSPAYPFGSEEEEEEEEAGEHPSSVTRIDAVATPATEPLAAAPPTQHSPVQREPQTLAAHDVAAALGRMMRDMPDGAEEEKETQTRLPLPAFTLEEERELAEQDPEITSVSRGSGADVSLHEDPPPPAEEQPPESRDLDMTRMQDL
jgi:hypothetical protein